MRSVWLDRPGGAAGDAARLARLTRHLRARLLDFDPGGPEVLWADEAAGAVAARFPGYDAGEVLSELERAYGVRAAREGEQAVFHLSPGTRFEDLDYLWGALNEIL